MYNNAIDGVSASGDRFFYVNRLASAGDGRDVRWQRASLECCPPNLVRFLASMPGFIYAQDSHGAVYVNLYVSSAASFTIGGQDAQAVGRQRDAVGWHDPRSRWRRAAMRAARSSYAFPGGPANHPAPGWSLRYADKRIDRRWCRSTGCEWRRCRTKTATSRSTASGRTATSSASSSRWTFGRSIADPRVKRKRRPHRDRARTDRLLRGVAGGRERAGARCRIRHASRDARAGRRAHGGATLVQMRARRMAIRAARRQPVTLIPYHLWANRGAGEMTVWLPTREYIVGDIGPAGGVIFYVNPNHAADGLALSRGGAGRSERRREMGLLPCGDRRRARHGGRHRAAEHADMIASCSDAETAAALCANYKLNGVGGWFLPSRDELALMYKRLAAAGLGHFGGAASPTTSATGRRRRTTPTWRLTSISPTTDVSTTTTRISRGACARFGRSDAGLSPPPRSIASRLRRSTRRRGAVVKR